MSPENKKPGDSLLPLLDAKSLIPKIIGGDELAAEILDGYLRFLLRGYYFRRSPPEELEDLTQETIIGVINGLSNFSDSNQGQPDFNIRFRKWCFGIARYTLVHEYKRRTRERQMQEDLKKEVTLFSEEPNLAREEEEKPNPTKEKELENLIPKLKEKLAEILTPDQLQVALLRLEGQKISEVMSALAITRNAYIHRMVDARIRCEEKLIFPAGFKKVENPSLLEAARRGTLQAVRFLGHYYTTPQWEQRYIPRKRSLSRRGAPTPEYMRLSELAQTTAEYCKVLRAVQDGTLPGKKIGKFWFVAQSDHAKYNDQQVPTQKKTRQTPETATGFSTCLQILTEKSYADPNRLAALLGVSRETVRGWLNGMSVPNEGYISALIQTLHATSEEAGNIMDEYQQLPIRRRRGH